MHELIQNAFRKDLPEAEFSSLALPLLRHQAESNPVYGAFLKASGLKPDRIASWEEFPALPVEAFRAGPVACFDPQAAELIFETSGTTGRSTGRHYLKDGRSYEAALAAGFRQFMPDLARHRWVSLIPSFDKRPRSSLAYMIRCLAGLIPENGKVDYVCDGEFVLDKTLLKTLLKQAVELQQKTVLFGTSFALAQAAEDFLEEGSPFKLPAGSLVFDTGGYKGRHRELSPPELVGLIGEAFGIPGDLIWNEYGMTELSSQGYGRLAEGLHRFPPWLKVRVIDPGTGQPVAPGQRGLLHFYDLANVHSVMAIATLDTGLQEGDAFRVLGRLPGAPERGCSLPFEL